MFCQHLRERRLFREGSHMDGFLAGAAGGVTAAAITYPLDTIRARLAFQVTNNTLYSGIKHVAVKMFKEVRIILIKIICKRHILAWRFFLQRHYVSVISMLRINLLG